ncbi:MAG: glycosyltransferase family 39 protein [Ilumatobacteraceae bacterium]|nr:glycosyltransferase family 39 protein [Ilumatobacteraceae bacterium]
MAVSITTNAWGLSAMGWGNAYYSAAVRSMGTSWHNFIFASFDAGGYVSVDKPPFSLWVQVISAKIFGYSELALLLPEVLAGAAAVWLLYWGLRRTWGTTAGLVGAAALAVTPINVVINHSNNTDSVLVLLMTAAAVTAMEAVRTGRLRWLLGACVLAGCAMTTKMLAAAPVMPGLLIAFGWCAPVRWRVRLGQVVVGALTLATVGLWWFVAVQATPAGARPYVGSTQTNSVFELAFERNGLKQVAGLATGLPIGGNHPPSRPPDIGAGSADARPRPRPAVDAPLLSPSATLSQVPDRGEGLPLSRNRANPATVGLGFVSGTPGVSRLLNRELGSEIGWLIPLGVVGALAGLWSTRLRRSPRLGALLVLGCWFGAGAIVFSSTKGVLHPYYLAGVGPPLAGLVGIGVATFRFDLEAGRRRALIWVAALGLTAWAQWVIWRRFDWRTWFVVIAVVAIAAAMAAVVIGWLARRRNSVVSTQPRPALVITAASVVAVLLAPAMWTQGSLQAGVSGPLPFAFPERMPTGGPTANQITPNGGFEFPSISVPSLDSYLSEHNTGERWDLAVQSAGPAEELIISSGEPVMAIGGFVGSDPIQSQAQVQDKVRAGELRYFLLSSGARGLIPGLFDNLDSVTWVVKRCAIVSSDVWEHHAKEDTAEPGTQAFPGGPTASKFTLFDCKGALD